MADRGAYRSIKVVLLDGPDFQRLPSQARWVFVALKLSFGPSGIEVRYPEALAHELAEKTGESLQDVKESLDLLESEDWIRREGNVVWIVGQLEHDPYFNPKDSKHRKSIQKHVKGLPRLSIVRDFIEAHSGFFPPDEKGHTKGLPRAYEGPSPGPKMAHRSSDKRVASSDEGVGSYSGSKPSRHKPSNSTARDGGLRREAEKLDLDWEELQTTLIEYPLLGEEKASVNGSTIGVGLLLGQYLELVDRTGDDPEHVLGAIEYARQELDHIDADDPFSLRIFLEESNGMPNYNRCLNRYLKALPTESMQPTTEEKNP